MNTPLKRRRMLKLNRITSGESVIVSSGVIMTFGGNPLDLYLGDDDNSLRCHIRFSFIVDNQVQGPLVRTRGLDEGDGINILMINFEQSLGRGVVNPIEIAHREGGESLFLSFVVNTYTGAASKQIAYTVFSKEMEPQNVTH